LAKLSNQLRIIGGEHRGRRLCFPDAKGLRPTSDRVRETLFNWLQGEVAGKRVLDLFAGSGALGLEALSRHAGFLVSIEKLPAAARQLKENIELLSLLDRSKVYKDDAMQWLERTSEKPFNLVFLDPPFAEGLLPNVLKLLAKSTLLADGAWVYVEQEASQPWPQWPNDWYLYREAKAGQVVYCLLKVQYTDLENA